LHKGEPGFVLTLLHVSETNLQLLGFATTEERRMYQRLISVSGVGAKVAMAALAHLSAQDIALALATRDEKRLSSVPGIGRKTAQRMILELTEQVAKEMTGAAVLPLNVGAPNAVQEAAEVLTSLGYLPSEAVTLASSHAGAGACEEIVRAALTAMDKAKTGKP